MYDASNALDVFLRFFGNAYWTIIYIISVAYLFFRVNAKGKRAFIGAIVILFLFFNDVTYGFYKKLGEASTYYRLLWSIPHMTLIGVAAVDLLNRFRIKIIGLAAVIGLCCCVTLIEAVNPFLSYYHAPVSPRLVSDDTAQIGDRLKELQEGKELFVIVPEQMREPLWLYDGDIRVSSYSLLGDGTKSGDEIVDDDDLDVAYILSVCCWKGYDYIVVPRRQTTEDRFMTIGHHPVFSSESYLMYACYGFSGFRQDLSDWGQITYKTYYDENGNPDAHPLDYSTVRYHYNRDGKRESEWYCDANGQACQNANGYYAVRYEGDGLHNTVLYLNEEGKPSETQLGYSSYEIVRNKDHEIVEVDYFDDSGNLLKSITADHRENGDLFSCLHCSEAARISGEEIILSSVHPQNKFNVVCLQLYDANEDRYLTSFAETREAGTVSGQYQHHYADGFYCIVLNGNTNMHDEQIRCFVYLKENDVFNYTFQVTELTSERVVVRTPIIDFTQL